MAELLFSEQADDALTRLEADPSRALLTGRLHPALDLLEADPGSAACRRRRYALIDLWGMTVTADGEDLLILWEPGPGAVPGTVPGTIVVHAITPAP